MWSCLLWGTSPDSFFTGLSYLKENNLLDKNFTLDMTCPPHCLINLADEQVTNGKDINDSQEQSEKLLLRYQCNSQEILCIPYIPISEEICIETGERKKAQIFGN